MAARKFLVCKNCGNMVGVLHDSGVPLMCCGRKMEELIPGTSDGAVEKHLPQVTVEAGKVHVQVGSALHPMLEAHYIEWIYVETTQGGQRKILRPGQEPACNLLLAPGEEAVAVYAYCNLHGLWKTVL